jgi:hypothetical protein
VQGEPPFHFGPARAMNLVGATLGNQGLSGAGMRLVIGAFEAFGG